VPKESVPASSAGGDLGRPNWKSDEDETADNQNFWRENSRQGQVDYFASGSASAPKAEGDLSIPVKNEIIRDSWMTGSIITLKAISGLFDDTGAMATAAANEPTSVTRMINSIATSLMQSHKDGSIQLPPHILDILATDNPDTLEETLANLIQTSFVTIQSKGRKLIIMSDSTLNFSAKKHDASRDLREIIDSYGK
jgi:hypothetical protein